MRRTELIFEPRVPCTVIDFSVANDTCRKIWRLVNKLQLNLLVSIFRCREINRNQRKSMRDLLLREPERREVPSFQYATEKAFTVHVYYISYLLLRDAAVGCLQTKIVNGKEL